MKFKDIDRDATYDNNRRDYTVDSIIHAAERVFTDQPDVSTVVLTWHGRDYRYKRVPAVIVYQFRVISPVSDCALTDWIQVHKETWEALSSYSIIETRTREVEA